MATPAAADLRPRRSRLWSNWLWILAAILGVAMLWSGARVIHDDRMRRETLRLLAEDKATEIGALGANRFDLLAADAFGPSSETANGRLDIDDLQRRQNERLACRCQDVLPTDAFFLVSLSPRPTLTRSADLQLPGGNPAGAIADSTLIRLANAEASRSVDDRRRAHVALVGKLVVLTLARPDTAHGT